MGIRRFIELKCVGIVLVSLLVMLGSFAGGLAQETLPDGSGLRVALVWGAVGNNFAIRGINGARAALEEMGAEVLYSNAAGNRDRHLANMENAIQMGVDGIITGQTLIEQFVEVIQRSMSEGIPVITLDAGPSPALSDVTSNNWVLGTQQGLTLLEYLPEQKGNIIEFYNPGYLPCDIRYESFRNVMRWFPEVETLAIGRAVYPNTVPEAKARMEAFLQQYPAGTIDAIYANYDLEGIGALQAMEEAGRTEIVIIGADCEPGAVESMSAGGPYKASVLQDAYEMGRQAAIAVVKYLAEDKAPPSTIYIPTIVVTQDNLDWALALLDSQGQE